MPGRSHRRVAVAAAVAVVAFLHLTPFLVSSEAVDSGESPEARLEKLEAAYDSLAVIVFDAGQKLRDSRKFEEDLRKVDGIVDVIVVR